MSIPEIPMSELHLEGLSEAERNAVFEVLQRDKELRQQETERIRVLRKEVNELQTSVVQWESSLNHDKICPMCHLGFGWIFNRGDMCPRCQSKVCDKCRQTMTASKYKWLCLLCFKQTELKARSGSWFYSKFRRSRRRIKDNSAGTRREDTPVPLERTRLPRSRENGIIPSSPAASLQRPRSSVDETDSRRSGQRQVSHSNGKTRLSRDAMNFPEEDDQMLLSQLLKTKALTPSTSVDGDDDIFEKHVALRDTYRGRVSESEDDRWEMPQRVDRQGTGSTVESGRRPLHEASKSEVIRRPHSLRREYSSSSSGTGGGEEMTGEFHADAKLMNGRSYRPTETQLIGNSKDMPVAETTSQRLSASEYVAGHPTPNRSSSRSVSTSNQNTGESKGNLAEMENQLAELEASYGSLKNGSPKRHGFQTDKKDVSGLLTFPTTEDVGILSQLSSLKTPTKTVDFKPSSLSDQSKLSPMHQTTYENDDDSLSIIGEQTESESDEDLRQNVRSLSNDQINGRDWWKGLDRELGLGSGEAMSAVDWKELDQFISRLAYDEMLANQSDHSKAFDSVTEKNRKVLETSLGCGIPAQKWTNGKPAKDCGAVDTQRYLDSLSVVTQHREIKEPQKQKSADAEVKQAVQEVRGQSKSPLSSGIDTKSSSPNIPPNAPAVTNVSIRSTLTVPDKTSTGKLSATVSDLENVPATNKANQLNSKTKAKEPDDVAVLNRNNLLSAESLRTAESENSKPRENNRGDFHDLTVATKPTLNVAASKKELDVRDKHLEVIRTSKVDFSKYPSKKSNLSEGLSDTLTHLASEELVLTGAPVHLENEIDASAAYNEALLSESEASLDLSDFGESRLSMELRTSKGKIDLESLKRRLQIRQREPGSFVRKKKKVPTATLR